MTSIQSFEIKKKKKDKQKKLSPASLHYQKFLKNKVTGDDKKKTEPNSKGKKNIKITRKSPKKLFIKNKSPKNSKTKREKEDIKDINIIEKKIKDSKNLFSLLQTPKSLRTEINEIKVNLDFNFLSNQIDVNRIKFDDIEDNDQALKILKELNDIKNFNFHKSRRIFNKVFEAYFG